MYIEHYSNMKADFIWNKFFMRPIIKFVFLLLLLFFWNCECLTWQIWKIEICMCQSQSNTKWTLLYFCIDFVQYYTTISYTNVSMFDNASMIDRLPSRPYSKMQRNKIVVFFCKIFCKIFREFLSTEQKCCQHSTQQFFLFSTVGQFIRKSTLFLYFKIFEPMLV